jgi:mRNA-degrading endonuclease RelE of RelBE toxin-antitoxin system
MTMPYREVLSKPFLADIKDIKKDKPLLERLHKKMDEILQNPEHYPMKKYTLKGKRATHVGSYVVMFEIQGNDVVFLRFKHHDYAYQ